jgi:tetraacyldisaccharide 4'-kinase
MKWWQIFLWPLSLLYGIVMAFRNWLYDHGWLKSYSFDVPTIVVGNLEMGGSGKSPFVDLLTSILKKNYKIGILSRGYGRSSKGFFIVDSDSEASLVGDESLMLKLRHPEVVVAVCENRVEGVTKMMLAHKQLDCIILDDAFQHRRLKADYYILLTQFGLPFYNNFVLPAGRLREFGSGKKRANAIIVTKTPTVISNEKRNEIVKQIKPTAEQSFHFANYKQGAVIQVFGKATVIEKTVILITGIAHSKELKIELFKSHTIALHLAYSDHYIYDKSSFNFTKVENSTSSIITTAKDWVKWQPFLTYLEGWKVYIAPVIVELQEADKLLNILKANIDLKKHGIR